MSDTPRDRIVAVVLAVLEAGPAHGYLIAQRIRIESGDVLTMREGSLYPVLHALSDQGCIESTEERHGDRLRRVYYLTALGQQRLAEERAQWQRHAQAIKRVLMGRGKPLHEGL